MSPKGLKRLNLYRPYFWPTAVALVVFFASSRSKVSSPDVSHFDKVAHFCVFGLLGTLVCRLSRGPARVVIATLVVSAFGASDEWHQAFVPGRSSGVDDWIADTLGAALGAGVYAGWYWYRCVLETPLGRLVRGQVQWETRSLSNADERVAP